MFFSPIFWHFISSEALCCIFPWLPYKSLFPSRAYTSQNLVCWMSSELLWSQHEIISRAGQLYSNKFWLELVFSSSSLDPGICEVFSLSKMFYSSSQWPSPLYCAAYFLSCISLLQHLKHTIQFIHHYILCSQHFSSFIGICSFHPSVHYSVCIFNSVLLPKFNYNHTSPNPNHINLNSYY